MNNIKYCQECDYPNPTNLTHCFKCNHDLSQPKYEEPPIVEPDIELMETPAIEEATEPIQQNNNRRFCRICGKPVSNVENFCANCGMGTKSGTNNNAVAILIVLIIIILGFILYSFGDRGMKDIENDINGKSTNSKIENIYQRI